MPVMLPKVEKDRPLLPPHPTTPTQLSGLLLYHSACFLYSYACPPHLSAYYPAYTPTYSPITKDRKEEETGRKEGQEGQTFTPTCACPPTLSLFSVSHELKAGLERTGHCT